MLKAILNPDCGSELNEGRLAKCLEVKFMKLTCQHTQKKQIFGVADDSLVSEGPEQHWRSMLKCWSNFLELINLLLR